MKTATIPPVRTTPEFRQELEQSLEEGETLAALVESAVRREVHRRREQADFLRRGLAAIARTQSAGDGVPADAVLSRLDANLAAARRKQAARFP
ncbi:YlcI/YnfO family protein [Xylophilus sp.]|uniref:YlcI/YnfO family protein n=1 Tax=Xylophilus sp. TaxID=2653893 RepID=UPI0013B61B79|nr:YlcI/YnfO family protein [Xylophilus sp.]KAF1049106.1 MAG: hypothetical protein GAK38_00873 [Xylophilus sp.]